MRPGFYTRKSDVVPHADGGSLQASMRPGFYTRKSILPFSDTLDDLARLQ